MSPEPPLNFNRRRDIPTVWLEAKRAGNDLDGRLYTVTVTAVDTRGNASSKELRIRVIHDQRP